MPQATQPQLTSLLVRPAALIETLVELSQKAKRLVFVAHRHRCNRRFLLELTKAFLRTVF